MVPEEELARQLEWRMMQVYEEMALNKITGNRGEEDEPGLQGEGVKQDHR